MISFRYHLISVIAIFLAIALGVVVGTTALNGAVVGDLRRQVSDLKHSNTDASAQNKVLQAQSGNADEISRVFGAKITAGALAKKSVVMVAAPGATANLTDAIAAQLSAAGAHVTGQLQLTKSFTDPQRANDIRSLATSGAHPIGLTLPSTDDPGSLAGALLGFVLLGQGQATDLTQVLAGFSTLGMLQTRGAAPSAGQAVVLVSPGSMPADDPSGKMLLSFAAALGSAKGATVIAGDAGSATDGGLIALVRKSADAKKSVSTVDDATGALGQVTVVLAVADALKGRDGQYGTGVGVDALVPNTVG